MIEFLLTFIFAVGFLVIFIHFSINTAVGYLAHYATFQAARTYLVMDAGTTSAYKLARSEATTVFNKIIRSQQNIYIQDGYFDINNHFRFPYPNRQGKLFVGAWFKFKQKFNIYSLIGGDLRAQLVSEAFLGKEPSRSQCKDRICKIMTLKTDYAACASPINAHNTLFDNGC